MFDYIFKRPANPAEAAPTPEPRIAVEAQVKDKEIALQQAKALGGEELAAVEFILQCQFADARLIAADNLHSKAMLERILPPMRKADRRVAKLLQARLDALAAAEQREQHAQHCLDSARKLAEEAVLLPNQAIDLDRAWQLVGTPSPGLAQAYEEARTVLRERLAAQAQLQRTVIDNLMHLRELAAQASGMAQADVAAALEKIEQEVAQSLTAREAPSLPKHLLAELAAQQQEFKSLLTSLAEIQQAIQARQDLLQRWEETDPQSELKEEVLRAGWSALPTLPSDAVAEAMQARFDTLLQRAIAARPQQVVQPKADTEKNRAGNPAVAQALETMEKALHEGAVRAALEVDKQLRSPELQGAKLNAHQNAQLAKLRGELANLQGWAKWGGNVSREELLHAAEELPAKALPVADLAKKVGGLRERWKSLDVSAGPANKDLWERFDAACTLAYAPAAAHFKKLAEERQANLRKAEALVAEVRQFALNSHCSGEDASAADWKAVAGFCAHIGQAWQRLGSIDRKDKKRLDGEFEQSLKALKGPLAVQQKAEAATREALIAETLALNPTDRATLDTVRQLQERWQQRAKALPLERRVEQALWQKFRAACDALFAKRKEAAHVADAERKQHLAAKESLCQTLEAAVSEPVPAIARILRETKDAWNKAGPVPRAQENQIESRFQAAAGALQKQMDAAKRIAADKELNALRDKVRLCMSVEREVVEPSSDAAPASVEQWQALPALSADFEKCLRSRFDKGLQAWQSKDAQYRASLEKNRSVLLQSLLRFEITSGVESPAQLARERLQMQVEVLQSTLKNGTVVNKHDLLMDLCKLAAAMDQATARRVEVLIGKLRSAA